MARLDAPLDAILEDVTAAEQSGEKIEVYINGETVDLQEELTLVATYGNISFGKLAKRAGVKSNLGSLPPTQRNKKIFESFELAGSVSDQAYRRNAIDIRLFGISVFEGFCTIEQAKDEYQFQAFAGASDFYTIINNKKLTQLDLSLWNHIWNEPNIKNSWNATKGYIYAWVDYSRDNPFYQEGLPPDFFLPQLFFHTLIKQIATDAGYTLMGDVLTNPRFLKHLVILNKWPLSIMYGGTWDLAAMLPDLSQSKMWLDFANIYGLQFDINELTKEIRANYIDDILFNDPEDWTGKVDYSERPETKPRFDEFGQTTYLRYKYEEFTQDTPAYQDFGKAVSIDDECLKTEADLYKSEFYLIQEPDPEVNPGIRAVTFSFVSKEGKSFLGIWNVIRSYNAGAVVWKDGTFYHAQTPTTGDEPSTSPTEWKPVAEKDVWAMKNRPMYGILTINPSSDIQVIFPGGGVQVTKIVKNTNMNWEYTYTHHYRLFDRIIQRTKRVDFLIKLNYADINQLDFTRAKRIDNDLYFLEEVEQFKLTEKDSTICKLVRI